MHLVRRFFGSLSPRPPRPGDDAWAESHLVPGEVALWRRMSNADRRHAVGVARRVVADLGPGAERPVVAAALLHDVGKIESGLGTFGRVAATVTGEVAGRARAQRWVTSRGARRRVGLYLSHPHLGADRLAAAGSDPLTVTWTAEHHLGAQAWTLDPDIAAALKAADDD